MKYYYGVDVGGTDIKVGLFSDDFDLIETFIVSTPKENQDETVLRKIHDCICENANKNQIHMIDVAGIGIAVPSPVKNGVALLSANIAFRKNKDIKRELEILFNEPIKIRVGNDASLAAYGEYKTLCSSHKNVCFYTLGTGIGGGIIIDGKLLEGSRGGAGELGHMEVEENYSVQCGCGKSGCLEQLSGTAGMIRYCKDLIKEKESSLREVSNLMPKDIFDAAKAGDEVGNMVVDRMTHYLAINAVNLATVLDPDIFIIGGGISKAGDFLIDRIREKYRQRARFDTGDIPFALAQLGNNAGIYGAAYLVSDKD
ncbi:ROK family protein [Acholeplasma sp. OttesenSCG-928-E16]|nr:ROK family protein [Acholeplasma sp. OttesenSCG-928-E16]